MRYFHIAWGRNSSECLWEEGALVFRDEADTPDLRKRKRKYRKLKRLAKSKMPDCLKAHQVPDWALHRILCARERDRIWNFIRSLFGTELRWRQGSWGDYRIRLIGRASKKENRSARCVQFEVLEMLRPPRDDFYQAHQVGSVHTIHYLQMTRGKFDFLHDGGDNAAD